MTATDFFKCPHCNEDKKDPKDVMPDGSRYLVYFDCLNCGKEFVRVYEWVKNAPVDEA